MVAGSETSSTALTWAIHFMTLNQDKQKRLRDEIRAVIKNGQETMTATTLNSIDYLDAFVKETLRLQPPVPMTVREAQKDDVLPLAEPLKLANGQEVSEIPIRKGTVIQIPMGQLAFDESVWGADVNEFKPERWLNPLPESVIQATGAFTAYSHMLTFAGGARACIGYRFSIAEIKAILAVIACDLQFDLEPGIEIHSRFMVVARMSTHVRLGCPLIINRSVFERGIEQRVETAGHRPPGCIGSNKERPLSRVIVPCLETIFRSTNDRHLLQWLLQFLLE